MMQITEPSTMITDYVLAVVTAALAFSILRRRPSRGAAGVYLWTGALVFVGVAALTGGTYHGFSLMLPVGVLSALWKITLAAIGCGSFCMSSGTALADLHGMPRRLVVAASVVGLLVYLWWIVDHSDFRFAVYLYGPSALIVLVIQVFVFVRRREDSARWFMTAILISTAGAVVLLGRFGLHRHFNHNDVFHIIQAVGAYFFYRGIRALQDR